MKQMPVVGMSENRFNLQNVLVLFNDLYCMISSHGLILGHFIVCSIRCVCVRWMGGGCCCIELHTWDSSMVQQFLVGVADLPFSSACMQEE